MLSSDVAPIIMGIVFTWISISVGVFAHIYRQIGQTRDRIETQSSDHLRDIWMAIRAIQVDIDTGRKETAEQRVRIAREMITKDDLARTENRIVVEMDRRVREAIRHRPPLEEQEA